jgi:uncharacterized membrane protein YfcA
MSVAWLICLGLVSGTGAGLLAGLIGIGGGIVIVPVMYYGLLGAGASADQAAHIAIATSLAAILPAALASSISHWRAGNTDLAFLREWGPGIALGVVAAQLVAPHLRGSALTGVFALFTLMAAVRSRHRGSSGHCSICRRTEIFVASRGSASGWSRDSPASAAVS